MSVEHTAAMNTIELVGGNGRARLPTRPLAHPFSPALPLEQLFSFHFTTSSLSSCKTGEPYGEKNLFFFRATARCVSICPRSLDSFVLRRTEDREKAFFLNFGRRFLQNETSPSCVFTVSWRSRFSRR